MTNAGAQALRTQALWDHLHSDARELAAARSVYRGSGDVLDALWWRLHPLAPTPSGTPDPCTALPALQAHVYARPVAHASPGPFDRAGSANPAQQLAVAQHELRTLDRRLSDDAAALDTLLERHDITVRPPLTTPRPEAAVVTTSAAPAWAHPSVGTEASAASGTLANVPRRDAVRPHGAA